MQANQLRPPKGAKHARKRVGRGNASGHGTYSTRGLKGQKSRAGRKPRRFFEGGQTELMRRLPRKRGFTNLFRVEFAPVNLRDLNAFEDGTEVTVDSLKEAGIISSTRKPVKVLGVGEVTSKLTVTVHRFSKTARAAIEAAGGTATALIPDKEPKAEKPKKARAKAAKAAKTESKAQDEEPKVEASAEAEAEAEGKDEDGDGE
jgi:large subunit ribosomal protein L15